ncbi:PAS domain-containing protein, partial [Pantoea sp. SIMBA_072]
MRWLAINRQAKHDFQRLFGRTPETGDYLPDLIDDEPNVRTLSLSMWQRALAGEQFVEIGTFGKAPEQYHYELRFNALRDQDGEIQGAFLFAYDISERVQEQKRLAKAEEA